MDSVTIDTLAKKREPLPNTALMADKMLYYGLMALYAGYKSGSISEAVARLEKKTLIERHKELEMSERLYNEHSRRMGEISRLLVKANKEGCPICKQMAMLFDGRQREAVAFDYYDHKYSGLVND